MKKFLLLSFITVSLVLALDKNWGSIPPLGRLLSPYTGVWQNGEGFEQKEVHLRSDVLNDAVEVYLDDRLVPHVFANNWEDATYVQGYLHAKYRLWQMDMTTRLAAGRLSEVLGSKTLKLDRYHRRIGMVYGAQQSVDVMMQDKETSKLIKAYTTGINDYINTLNSKAYPVEYKLLNFKPEPWTELKSALMLKYIAKTLSSRTDDISNTLAKQVLDERTYELLFPERLDEEFPVVREQCKEEFLSVAHPKSETLKIKVQDFYPAQRKHAEKGIGSNNWAVAPSKSQSGYAMLSNDPHLPVSLPSIWFECHIHLPQTNVYGASLPGAPGIIIGFNDSISWGFTNGYRDVLDYFRITYTDSTHRFYLLNNIHTEFNKTIETIKVRGEMDYIDTVLYTYYGPMSYDENFPMEGLANENLAVKWMAHKGTNELKAIKGLNDGKNYNQYVEAIKYFQCPHQNIVYADVRGNIAIWSQGAFVNKWPGQGSVIMDGNDISMDWGPSIPFEKNPHEKNPLRGYVMSANQINTDVSYPYWYNGGFDPSRAKRLDFLLSQKKKYTIQDMLSIQLDTYNQLFADFLVLASGYMPAANVQADALNTDVTLFAIWWNYLEEELYNKGPLKLPAGVNYPGNWTTLQVLRKNSLHLDLGQLYAKTFVLASADFEKLKTTKQQSWFLYKKSTVQHMARIPAFGKELVEMDGARGVLNAAEGGHAPSWRMTVEMGNKVRAWVSYPGGQSGNPFSPYYLTNFENWRIGKYTEVTLVNNPSDIPHKIATLYFKKK